jgi:hypothetical protein
MTITPLRWFFGVAAALAFVAGVLLFAGASETDRFFSWTIEPPLTAAFMGAAYWAALVLLAWAASRERWAEARTAIPPVFAIAVLLLAATLIHLDKFDLESLFGWFWLVVYVIVPPLLVVLLLRQSRVSAGAAPAGRPLPLWLKSVLVAQAGVLLVAGVALFVAPLDAAEVWPWALTPLTGRAIAAFLVGFGIAAAAAARDDDLARARGPAMAYVALGALELLAVAIHSGDFAGSGLEQAVYVGFWVTTLGVGAYGVAASGGSVTDRSPASPSR